MNDLLRNAIAMGVFAGFAGFLARRRRAPITVPILLVLGVATAFGLEMVDMAWLPESVRRDVPWLGAAALAVWMGVASGGWLRVTQWWAVVLATALLGDVLVTLGIIAAEPDPDRRARLVVAAGGASMIGPLAGEATLMLGWGGVSIALLGLVMSLVGFTRGGANAVARPAVRAMIGPALVALLLAPLAWLAVLGWLPELMATTMETAMLRFPGRAPLMVLGAGIVGGGVFHEGGAALFAHQALDRALSLRDDTMRQAFLVGLSVGSTLPMLLLARARLRVGLPLWLVQAGLAFGYIAWRWS